MTPIEPFWQSRSHALLAPNIMFPQALVLMALLLRLGAFMIALGTPVRLQGLLGLTLAP